MARHERQFEAVGEARFDFDELLGALRTPVASRAGKRCEAMARCLSAGEGWRDAAASLGGAFATLAEAPGLTRDKE